VQEAKQAEDRILSSLRLMAWHRAKGELFGLLHTYWPDDGRMGSWEKSHQIIRRFIKDMEEVVPYRIGGSVEDSGMMEEQDARSQASLPSE